jgi:AAA+ ATPase superfamily predicted ATPase
MATTDRRLKAFLSYSPSESNEVRSLYQRLLRDGVDAWLDTEKVLARHDWQRQIEEAVRSADVILICFSEDFQLEFRQEEVRIALEEAEKHPRGETFIVPVRLGEVQPPEFLDRYPMVDLFRMDGYELLLESLRSRAEQLGLTPESITQEKTVWTFALDNLRKAWTLEGISKVSGKFPRFSHDLNDFQRNLLLEIETISQSARAAMNSETNYNRRQQLENALQRTRELTSYVVAAPAWQAPFDITITLKRWMGIFDSEIAGTQKWEPIPNVYVAGMPLEENSAVFKGRKDIVRILERELATQATQRPALLLFGARRTGKTSVLKQFPDALGPQVIPVMVDLQGLALTNNIATFFEQLSDSIRKSALASRRVEIVEISRPALEADPYTVFASWMKTLEEMIENKWLLLSLDEYEYIETLVESRRADARIFQLLRSLLQNYPRITLLFSGTHTFEELNPVWSHHLINVHTIKIGDLEQNDARELIETPIKSFPLKYEPEAVERILSVVGGQPYLLQVTCRELVNLMNDKSELHARVSHVNQALDSALISGAAYFKEVWKNLESSDSRRKVMAAIARKKGNPVPERSLLRAGKSQELKLLIDHDVIEKADDGYRFKVELVRRWIEKQI